MLTCVRGASASTDRGRQTRWRRKPRRRLRDRRRRRRRRRRTSAKSAAKKTSAKSGKSGKYVYLFGKKTDGNGTMKPLLGGKGANLAEMCRIGLPVPPGFTITTEVCTYYYDHKRTYPSALQGADEGRHRRASRSRRGKKFGDLEEPAARVGALRRARLDAGHDGHDPQPRPERPDRRSAGEEDRQPAVRLGLLPPLRPDVRRRRARRAEAAGRGSRAVRDGHRDAQARALSRGHRGHQAHRRGPARSWSPASRRWSRSAPARISRPRRGIS